LPQAAAAVLEAIVVAVGTGQAVVGGHEAGQKAVGLGQLGGLLLRRLGWLARSAT
jgi:hypothetical protein